MQTYTQTDGVMPFLDRKRHFLGTLTVFSINYPKKCQKGVKMTLEEARVLAEFYNQCEILSEETRQKLIGDLFKNQD